MKQQILLLILLVVLSACSSQSSTTCPDGKGCDFDKGIFEEQAENFVLESPTYLFDGSDLLVVSSNQLACDTCARIKLSFSSSHGGYGDRTDQILSQVVVEHEVEVVFEQGEIVSAIMDDRWDVQTQQLVSLSQERFHQCTVSEREKACTKEYDPVCAITIDAGEETFGNACAACSENHVVSWNKGECASEKNYCETRENDCPELWMPVCGYQQADPADPESVDMPVQSYANYCLACQDEIVGYYIKGECA